MQWLSWLYDSIMIVEINLTDKQEVAPIKTKDILVTYRHSAWLRVGQSYYWISLMSLV